MVFHHPDDPHIRLQKPFQGLVEFEDVMFYHPSDASLRVLNKLSLVLRPKQTLALVGPSGCGKSTIFRILQRFCDIDSGSVVGCVLSQRQFFLEFSLCPFSFFLLLLLLLLLSPPLSLSLHLEITLPLFYFFVFSALRRGVGALQFSIFISSFVFESTRKGVN